MRTSNNEWARLQQSEFTFYRMLSVTIQTIHMCIFRYIEYAVLSKSDAWKGSKEALPDRVHRQRASAASQGNLIQGTITTRKGTRKRLLDEDGDPDDDDPDDDDFFEQVSGRKKQKQKGGITPQMRRFLEKTYIYAEAEES